MYVFSLGESDMKVRTDKSPLRGVDVCTTTWRISLGGACPMVGWRAENGNM